MGMLVWVVSAIAGLYGLGHIIFAFVDAPSSIGYLFRTPSMFYFLSERGGRIMMGLICFAVAFFASAIVPMFWG